MLLDKSREALAGAARALDALRIAEASGPEDFRLQFVESIGMIRRVGSIIDVETKGRRTNDFGLFWQEAGTDPLHQFVTEVRNAEFKKGRAEAGGTLQNDVGGAGSGCRFFGDEGNSGGRFGRGKAECQRTTHRQFRTGGYPSDCVNAYFEVASTVIMRSSHS